MFCMECGKPVDDDAVFCGNCGTQVRKTAAENNHNLLDEISKFIKTNWLYILSGVSTMAFIWGVLNMFCVFYPVDKFTNTHVPLSDLEGATGVVMVYIGNIIFGLLCQVAAGIGVLCFLEKLTNKPIYDQFIGNILRLRPGLVMGALGTTGVMTQMTFYLCCADAGVNWTSWLMLFIFSGIAVYDVLVLEKKERAEKPAV